MSYNTTLTEHNTVLQAANEDHAANSTDLQAVLDAVNSLPAAAQSKSYELIETITLEEDTTSVTRTEEPDGTAYNLAKLKILASVAAGSATGKITPSVYVGQTTKSTAYAGIDGAISGSTVMYWKFNAALDGGSLELLRTAPSSNSEGVAHDYVLSHDIMGLSGHIQKIAINSMTSGVPIPAGSIFEIWGVRA